MFRGCTNDPNQGISTEVCVYVQRWEEQRLVKSKWAGAGGRFEVGEIVPVHKSRPIRVWLLSASYHGYEEILYDETERGGRPAGGL